MKHPPKSLGIKRALDLLRRSDHRLMLMTAPDLPNGKAYYVVPGGYIEPADAEKIISRPDVHPFDDGLFPGYPQSWKIGYGS